MKSNYLSHKTAALLLGGALLTGGLAVVATVHAGGQEAKAKNIGLVVDDRPLQESVKLSTSFAPIVKKVAPSVVKVEIKIPGKEFGGNQGPFDDPFLRQFFGNQFGRQNFSTPTQHGVGSGVIVTKDGYILTNNHVVDDASEVKVTLNDGTEHIAKVIGKDPKSDVAVIKIEADNLPAITLADSGKAEVGDTVLAIGNPFAVGETVTKGIISATGRATLGLGYEDFLQTDAAINPGNSGGALVDAEGRLIGINTAIYSQSGGNEGIGFAIPTDLARGVMVSLIEYGKVTRGYLGVSIQNLNPALAKQFDLQTDQGALVGGVVPNGPADKAGLKSGDVIVQFNGQKVVDSRHLKIEVGATAPGQSVTVEIVRDGSPKTVEINVKELPDSDELASGNAGSPSDDGTLQGVAVENLDSQARQQFNIPQRVQGVVVTQVDPNSPAAAPEVGLKPGDVIMEINHHPVKDADDAVRLTEHARNKMTLLHIWSGEGSRYVVVDESKAG
jgi:serine protease Do